MLEWMFPCRVKFNQRIVVDRKLQDCGECPPAFAVLSNVVRAFADQSSKTAAMPGDPVPTGPDGRATSVKSAVPECLHILKLSPSQHEQVEGVLHEYDGDIDAAWAQCGARYRATIEMEASLLAAIEDNLTEPQRLRVGARRRELAQHGRSVAERDSKSGPAASKPADAAQEGIGLSGVSLTEDQESMADKIQEKYLNYLLLLSRDLQGLHARLVSLEADKLAEIEKILTHAQLQQLRECRQTAPAEAAIRECLERLKLSQTQHEQIQGLVQKGPS